MNAPVIDIGAFLDDPTAERVRDAFNKVNDANAYLFPLLNEGTKVSEIFRAFISGSGSLTAQAAASINAGALFTLQANRLGIVSFIEWKGEPFNSDFIKRSFLLKTGARDYGVGSPAIIPDDLFELPTKEVSVSSDFLFDLGNIGTSTIEDYVNANGTYSINGLAVFEAIQDGDEKAWLFTGGNGNWGFGATPVTASMFVDLGSQAPIPVAEVFEENVIGTLNVNNNVSGDVVLDWKNNTEWKYTLVGVTDFTSINLPTNGTQLRTIWLTGEFAHTFPGGVTFRGDNYDGTKWNKITIHYVQMGFIDGIIEVTELMV